MTGFVMLDPNAHSLFHSASSWAFQNRPEHMQSYVDRMDREATLHAWQAAKRLVAALAERHSLLVDEAVSEVEKAIVARAVLSPDSLPDGAL